MCSVEADGIDPLVPLLGAIRSFVDTPARELTAFQLGEHLIRLRRGIDLLELDFAIGTSIFAATDEYEVQGSISPIDWVRHNCHMSSMAAARAVTSGEQAGRLQASVRALDAGEIGFAHFSLLASVARSLSSKQVAAGVGAGSGDDASEDAAGGDPASGDPALAGDAVSGGDAPSGDGGPDPSDPTTQGNVFGFDERPLLEMAREHSVGRFGMDCTQARHAYDAAAVLREHVDNAERNRCEFTDCEGGFLAIRGYFDPVAAATLKTAVFPLAKPSGVRDTRTFQRRLADALVEVASHALDLGAVPGTGRTRAHLQLTASVETVKGLKGAPGGVLEHGGAVTAATVQRLACDARIRRVLLGPKSAITDVGRALRLPGTATRAALRARSGGCEWPKCDRPVAFTNAHHLVHWARGGATNLANLVLLCYRHHWSIHEGGWQLARDEKGRMLAIAPTPIFRTWTRAPDTAGV
jgi:hypothetical protein